MLVESASGMDEHYNSEEKCAPIEENNSETETRLRTVKHNSLSLYSMCPINVQGSGIYR